MRLLQPFLLDPILVERPWGGRRLATYGKRLPRDVWIGESWEVADLPKHVANGVSNPSSRVASGPFLGASLASVMAEAGADLLGPVPPTSEGRFPLLFKLLDAREHLSVQVHPHHGYVAKHPDARLKTESWYVIEADEDSLLYLDVVEGIDRRTVEDAIGTNRIVPLLHTVPAVPGGFHHVPAGLVHAMGAGVLVAEVQTPSDTTFRIYDWAEEYGRAPRPLHPVEGFEALQTDHEDAFDLPPSEVAGPRDLVANDHYWMREHRYSDGAFELSAEAGPKVLNVVSGSIVVGDLTLAKGATAIVPASSQVDHTAVVESAVVLEIGFPALIS